MDFEGKVDLGNSDQELLGTENPETQEKREKILSETIRNICRLFTESAEKYLQDDPELMSALVDFYGDETRLEQELRTVFENKEESELQDAVQKVEQLCNSEEAFRSFAEQYIETFQSTTERANSFKRRDARRETSPLASDQEFKLGTYRESIESQVSDAVFELDEKGYRPFESGMTEDPNNREQFIGFYDVKITIPQQLVELLEDEGFEIRVEEMDDRTQIRISPPADRKVRKSEWKAVWDQVSYYMEESKRTSTKSDVTYGYHQEFRDFQEGLRNRPTQL